MIGELFPMLERAWETQRGCVRNVRGMEAEKVNGRWVKVIRRKVIATPIEALNLVEDMKGLDAAKALIKELRVESLGENRDEVLKEVWSLNQLLVKWGNYAQKQLRQRYLKV